MKLRTVLPMLAVATFALAACAPKVDYAKFHEKAVEACKKDAGYKKVTIKGTEKGSIMGMSIELKFDHVYEKNGDDWKKTKGEDGAADLAAAEIFLMKADVIPEDEKAEYYAGSTFKVVYKDGDDKSEMTFDKFGYLTSEKGKSEGMEVDLKISWSK